MITETRVLMCDECTNPTHRVYRILGVKEWRCEACFIDRVNAMEEERQTGEKQQQLVEPEPDPMPANQLLGEPGSDVTVPIRPRCPKCSSVRTFTGTDGQSTGAKSWMCQDCAHHWRQTSSRIMLAHADCPDCRSSDSVYWHGIRVYQDGRPGVELLWCARCFQLFDARKATKS